VPVQLGERASIAQRAALDQRRDDLCISDAR
jgi:hypothetical protein